MKNLKTNALFKLATLLNSLKKSKLIYQKNSKINIEIELYKTAVHRCRSMVQRAQGISLNYSVAKKIT